MGKAKKRKVILVKKPREKRNPSKAEFISRRGKVKFSSGDERSTRRERVRRTDSAPLEKGRTWKTKVT